MSETKIPETSAELQSPKGYRGKHAALQANFKSKGYEAHVEGASDMYLESPTPSDRELVMTKRSYNELIANDGSKTYLVHSTTLANAQKAMQEGLKTRGTADNPNFESTVVALSGPNDKDQVAKNAYNLAYQYAGGAGNIDDRTAKVIIEIPKPTPDIHIGRDVFQGTHLSEVDGRNIVDLGPIEADLAGNDRLYAMPAGRVMGYIDFANEAAWAQNPNFEAQHPSASLQAVGNLAIKNSTI